MDDYNFQKWPSKFNYVLSFPHLSTKECILHFRTYLYFKVLALCTIPPRQSELCSIKIQQFNPITLKFSVQVSQTCWAGFCVIHVYDTSVCATQWSLL
jgi:hypothetical protein